MGVGLRGAGDGRVGIGLIEKINVHGYRLVPGPFVDRMEVLNSFHPATIGMDVSMKLWEELFSAGRGEQSEWCGECGWGRALRGRRHGWAG